ncbi:Uncharacterised protein [Chlamydia trachomatis]|nr:Uncharacterised protein [Chlamydia trachomatis]
MRRRHDLARVRSKHLRDECPHAPSDGGCCHQQGNVRDRVHADDRRCHYFRAYENTEECCFTKPTIRHTLTMSTGVLTPPRTHSTSSPRLSYTLPPLLALPPRMARSRAMMVATTPSIFSVERCLSGLMLPAGSVRT